MLLLGLYEQSHGQLIGHIMVDQNVMCITVGVADGEGCSLDFSGCGSVHMNMSV